MPFAEGMIFRRPVKVGWRPNVIQVDAWRRPRQFAHRQKVTDPRVTFVALHAEGQPILARLPSPSLI